MSIKRLLIASEATVVYSDIDVDRKRAQVILDVIISRLKGEDPTAKFTLVQESASSILLGMVALGHPNPVDTEYCQGVPLGDAEAYTILDRRFYLESGADTLWCQFHHLSLMKRQGYAIWILFTAGSGKSIDHLAHLRCGSFGVAEPGFSTASDQLREYYGLRRTGAQIIVELFTSDIGVIVTCHSLGIAAHTTPLGVKLSKKAVSELNTSHR